MAEWFKAAVLKTAVGNSHRGFESHSLLHFMLGDSLTVELPTLTRTVLVRNQVPQPIFESLIQAQ
jgi:hypothetical protein